MKEVIFSIGMSSFLPGIIAGPSILQASKYKVNENYLKKEGNA